MRSVRVENGSGGTSPGCISTAAQSIVLPAIRLGAWSPYCRSFASIENPELDAAEVRHSPHQTVQRVNLADEMPLPEAADRGIAGHCADGGEAMSNQCGLGAH